MRPIATTRWAGWIWGIAALAGAAATLVAVRGIARHIASHSDGHPFGSPGGEAARVLTLVDDAYGCAATCDDVSAVALAVRDVPSAITSAPEPGVARAALESRTPSFQDLLARRIANAIQSGPAEDACAAIDIALVLDRLGPPGALDRLAVALRGRSSEGVQTTDARGWVRCEARLAGQRGPPSESRARAEALVAWLSGVDRRAVLESMGAVMQELAPFEADPVVAPALDGWFDWRRGAPPDDADWSGIAMYADDALWRSPTARAHVLAGLADRRHWGDAVVRNGRGDVLSGDGEILRLIASQKSLPPPETVVPLRVADAYALSMSHYDGLPRFDPFAPEPARDALLGELSAIVGSCGPGRACVPAAVQSTCSPGLVRRYRQCVLPIAPSRDYCTIVEVPPCVVRCDHGDMDACTSLGSFYEDGKSGVPLDLARAAKLDEQACHGGNGDACAQLASLLERGDGVRVDVSRAAQLYDRSCATGNAGACTELGFLYATGKGVAKDLPHAAPLFKRACDLADRDGCRNLAVAYENGAYHPSDEAAAADLFDDQCHNNLVTACVAQGEMLARGAGVAKDEARAAQLFERACDTKQLALEACTLLAELAADGRGIPKDEGRARDLFKKGCEEDAAATCAGLGFANEMGADGIAVDRRKARALYLRGCKDGDAWFCARAKGLE